MIVGFFCIPPVTYPIPVLKTPFPENKVLTSEYLIVDISQLWLEFISL